MSVDLCMQPKVSPRTWQEFCSKENRFGIAIDGYVIGKPKFNDAGPWVNFNHHEGVNRLATRATCGQVYMAVRQGLFSRFQDIEGPRAVVFANDCDEDVCLSWFILKWGRFPEKIKLPTLEQLVNIVDLIDTTSGACAISLQVWEKIAWIFEPYRRFRLSGEVDKKDEKDFLNVVKVVESRILRHVDGQGESIPLDTRYERVKGVHLSPRMVYWSMIKEIGAQARVGMFNKGVRAYVSVRERPDGKSWTYTVGRTSEFVPFDLAKIFSALNKAEGCTDDRWGGGNTIGGSPRVEGSRLSPEKVERIITQALG